MQVYDSYNDSVIEIPGIYNDVYIGQQIYDLNGNKYIIISYEVHPIIHNIRVQEYDRYLKNTYVIYEHTVAEIEEELNRIGFKVIKK